MFTEGYDAQFIGAVLPGPMGMAADFGLPPGAMWPALSSGLVVLMLGAFLIAPLADSAFGLAAYGTRLRWLEAWVGVAAYGVQLLNDFAGYSHMALGLALLFGLRLPVNFLAPYTAGSIIEFWRRWHMSLSSWFRDYLYVPLGGNRVTPARTYVNLVTVFFLCGLWHGASWNFVIWGLFHGAFLVIERLGLAMRIRSLWRPLRHVYLLLVVMVGWVFFRADTLPGALAFLAAMAGRGATAPTPFTVQWYLTPLLWLTLAAGVVGSMPIGPSLDRWRAQRAADTGDGRAPLPIAVAGAGVVVLVLLAAIVQIAARTYNPFIYFRF